ncbi:MULTISPECIES: hypothetical protein [unclassified Halobacteriovorax]|uniref:hypothetical protein n=1 Tax=unclassified Halobacteriovorax TaxID=2639665 RepID=UPI000EA0B1B4|nr:hypothetical protein [Halobacteriovorax sp. BALOs_7]AYF44651.1 hypothetical protein BALOs_1651 [Halobacteriovorax sp. BALOs_7]
MSKKIPENEAIHFLHDLLNHTHGLKLFLEARENDVEGMGKESLALIYQEIQALENQIASQFDKLTAKAKTLTVEQLTTYISEQFKLYNLEFSIKLDKDLSDSTLDLDIALFERMIKNIVKNIFLWSNKKDLKVFITSIDESIELIFENTISQDFSEQDPSNSVGLHSLASLAKKQDISFKSWAKNHKWYTSIRIKKLGYSQYKLVS